MSADTMRAPTYNVAHLLSAVQSEMTRGSEKGDPSEKGLKVTLEDRDLWRRFSKLTNEMIVTKSGRRMFPVLSASVTGLNPNAMYSILLDFTPADEHRWKYVNGEWVPGGKPDSPPPSTAYIHPDSPNFGAHWMKQCVSFSKVKLSNKLNGTGQIMLNSLHKYEPRIHVIRVGGPEKQRLIRSFSFPETQFIAVTAYQNEDITQLKIKFNPFAKAFLDIKEKGEHDLDECHDHQQPRYPQLGSWFLPSAGTLCPPSPHHQFPPSLGMPSPVSHSCAVERYSSLRTHRSTPYPPPPYEQKYSPTSAYATDASASTLPLLPTHEAWSPLGSSTHHTSNITTTSSHQYGSVWPPATSSAVPPASISCSVGSPVPTSLLRAAYTNYSQPSTSSITGVHRPPVGSMSSCAGYQNYGSPSEAQAGLSTTDTSGTYPAIANQLCPGKVGAWSPLTPPSPGM
ncbi:brachyury protein homolog [Acanthaster planci]|uniref:T-box transcription factor T homolog n=1 Tax=Acanthaster planci TaxID=133434 RepID=A0A8B7XMW3_ACAPL|nr:brachyury protein homolog [Acanthaster planci]